MNAAEPVALSQAERVVDYRVDVLMQAGYDEHQALDLAIRTHVDLHQAVELLEHGCPAEIAVEILR